MSCLLKAHLFGQLANSLLVIRIDSRMLQDNCYALNALIQHSLEIPAQFRLRIEKGLTSYMYISDV